MTKCFVVPGASNRSVPNQDVIIDRITKFDNLSNSVAEIVVTVAAVVTSDVECVLYNGVEDINC